MKLLEKFLYYSVGFATQTNEKLTDLVQKLIEQGKISTTDAKSFLDEYLKNATELIDKFDDILEDFVVSILECCALAKEEELEDVRKRIEKIEALLKEETN